MTTEREKWFARFLELKPYPGRIYSPEEMEEYQSLSEKFGPTMDELNREITYLMKHGRQDPNIRGTHMQLPAIVNCYVDRCRHCGTEFVAWHVYREPYDGPQISGRLSVMFCPSCGKGW